jgi:hypothetical protein
MIPVITTEDRFPLSIKFEAIFRMDWASRELKSSKMLTNVSGRMGLWSDSLNRVFNLFVNINSSLGGRSRRTTFESNVILVIELCMASLEGL